METAEKQHAKRVEQTLASINKNLERIAKSLEKMEPVYLTTLTAEEEKTSEIGPVYPGRDPAAATENASKVDTPNYWRDCLYDTFKP